MTPLYYFVYENLLFTFYMNNQFFLISGFKCKRNFTASGWLIVADSSSPGAWIPKRPKSFKKNFPWKLFFQGAPECRCTPNARYCLCIWFILNHNGTKIILHHLKGYSIPKSNFWSKDSICTIITGKWQKKSKGRSKSPKIVGEKRDFSPFRTGSEIADLLGNVTRISWRYC